MLKEVTVVRYLRPEGLNDNLGGVTFVFDLDYVTRKVDVSFSLCAPKENFNKKLGIEIARQQGVVREYNLDQFKKLADHYGGFVDAYWNSLTVYQALAGEELTERESLLLKKFDYEYGIWRMK